MERAHTDEMNFQRAFDFAGKVAIVTGAANGIGKVIADVFHERGARLALFDRDPAVESVAKALGDSAASWSFDIRDEAAVEAAVRDVAARFGRIDVLVNNAGVGGVWPAESTTREDWDLTIAINLTGPFLVTRAVAPTMLKAGYGRIVIMASQAAVIVLDGHAAYSASKAGLLGMMRCMAIEWGGKGVTVNAISPTLVDTEMTQMFWGGEKGVRARAEIPAGRFALPHEIAMAALFLASDGAAMINGANLVIDGGFTVK
jgi:NAD(P)-dependent dehydrogenase (short-subunit alcohol dehydrogenase family)